MPLALLLRDAFGSWQRDVSKLSGWNQLVDLEDTLLGRVRGAFLGRWFGASLPMFAGDVRVAIANLDELSARYAQMRRQAMQRSDLNLTEPVAGIAGTMVGALLAPTSSMMLMAVISEQMPNWITTLAAVLNWLLVGAIGLLVFAIGVPVAAVALPIGAIASDTVVVVHNFLGTLARLFSAARRFLEQLLGPREQVRNPLLAQLLGVLDSVATLAPFLFALVAFIVIWAGPKLAPLASQLNILIPLARDVFAIVQRVLIDLFERLHELYTGKRSPWAIVQGIIWTLGQWFALVIDEFIGLYKVAAPAFEKVPVISKGKKTEEIRAWLEIKKVLGGAFDKVMPFVKQMTTENWLLKRIKEIAARLTKISDVLTTQLVRHPVKKDDGFKEKAKEKAKEKLKAAAPAWPSALKMPKAPLIPDFPSAGEIFAREEWLASLRWVEPDIVEAFKKPEGGYLFVLGPEGEKKLAALRRPPVDVFAGERKALLGGRKREEVLGEAQAIETRLRTLLFAVIDNLLPPVVSNEVPKLQGLLWELDDYLYGKKAEFPVRDLPGGDRLSLKVRRVRVRAPGMKGGVVRNWSKDLKMALEKQVYRTERLAPA